MPDEVGSPIPPEVLPYRIKCRGRRRDGRSCQTLLAVVEHGIVIVRVAGYEIIDPRSVKCPRCKTVRAIVGGVPEEFGGSSGLITREAS